MLAHALDLLLGGRAQAGLVRPGAAEAYVEGVFALPGRPRGGRSPSACRRTTEELVLARRVWRGRAHARVRRRPRRRRRRTCASWAAAARVLRSARAPPARRSPRRSSRSSTASAGRRRRRGAPGPRRPTPSVRGLERRLDELRERAGARDRELDLLEFELARDRGGRAERGRGGRALGAPSATACATSTRCAAPPLARRRGARAARPARRRRRPGRCSRRRGRARRRVDGRRSGARRAGRPRAGASRIEAERPRGGAAPLREGHRGADAGRLDEVEERLARDRPAGAQARRHRRGGARARRALPRAPRRAARRRGRARGGARRDSAAARDRRDAARRRAARGARGGGARAGGRGPRPARRARDGRRRVRGRAGAAGGAAGPRAPTRVEFRIAPNPGVPAGPLREIASGGELSRVMLALIGVAHDAEAGGGGSARSSSTRSTPGSAARRRAPSASSCASSPRAGQVLCITHLPQVASLADAPLPHREGRGRRRRRVTTVEALDGDAVVGELVRMLGAEDSRPRGPRARARAAEGRVAVVRGAG